MFLRRGHTDVVRVLLEHGAPVDGPATGPTGHEWNLIKNPSDPLTEAVEGNSTEAAGLLIDAGANVFPIQANAPCMWIF